MKTSLQKEKKKVFRPVGKLRGDESGRSVGHPGKSLREKGAVTMLWSGNVTFVDDQRLGTILKDS